MVKKTGLAIAVLMCSLLMQAQTVKILFDATKAETAGNADWVIDADTHNIGYTGVDGTPVVGKGSESNPQRYPSPAQSGVINSTNETYWEGALSAWGIDCVKLGYEVETLPIGDSITYGVGTNPQDLENYKVFVIDEPNIWFTKNEKVALMNFIQNGGGLFIISDHCNSDRNNNGEDSPQVWDDFFKNNPNKYDPFGIIFDSADFSETSTNVAVLPTDSVLHGPYGNPTELQWSNGTSITINASDNASVVADFYKTSATNPGTKGIMFAHARYGNGKVAVMGDSSPADDGTGDPNDGLYNGWTADAKGNHELLIMNATIWLAEGGNIVTGNNANTIAEQKFDAYPNPATNTLNLLCNALGQSKSMAIEIMDVSGREVMHENINIAGSNLMPIDISSLAGGIYFIKVLTDRSSETLKFIKL